MTRYLDRFVHGSNGIATIDLDNLLKLFLNSIGSEFGGRHELCETSHADNYENIRIETILTAKAAGEMETLHQMMGKYDPDG